MCYVAALYAASLVATAAGTAISANAQSNAADYQAQIARNNAAIANDNARASIAAGTVRAQADLAKGDQRLGLLRATAAANGVDIGSGSTLDLQGDVGRTTAQNAYTTQYNADLQAAGFRGQATQFTEQAANDDMAASNATTAGVVGGLSSLLSSASGFASKWDSYSRVAGGAGSAVPAKGGLY